MGKIIDIDIQIPIIVIKDKPFERRGVSTLTTMINGRAPYGSSEDESVWTVYVNELDIYGSVISFDKREFQKWSDYGI